MRILLRATIALETSDTWTREERERLRAISDQIVMAIEALGLPLVQMPGIKEDLWNPDTVPPLRPRVQVHGRRVHDDGMPEYG